ncbi:hypothetical protein [Microbacterium hominis]|uniref:Uncharacterized protein n=1 Tax=Microbacterium hominis TaxID=162426 RepID=A0A7D4UJ52_9MICO|nr:hypothetical protein [Microbacterium hominis]QKJ20768.1 hypothetical protein HQM25_16320 [Microbacterium hominis]
MHEHTETIVEAIVDAFRRTPRAPHTVSRRMPRLPRRGLPRAARQTFVAPSRRVAARVAAV